MTLAGIALDLRRSRSDVLLPYCGLPNVVCGLIWRYTGATTCIWNQRDVLLALGDGLARRAARNTPVLVSNSSHAAAHLVDELGVPPTACPSSGTAWLPSARAGRASGERGWSGRSRRRRVRARALPRAQGPRDARPGLAGCRDVLRGRRNVGRSRARRSRRRRPPAGRGIRARSRPRGLGPLRGRRRRRRGSPGRGRRGRSSARGPRAARCVARSPSRGPTSPEFARPSVGTGSVARARRRRRSARRHSRTARTRGRTPTSARNPQPRACKPTSGARMLEEHVELILGGLVRDRTGRRAAAR